MSKSIYSEEELKQLIQNLFLEKKKVKELEQKMQLLEQEHQCLISENQQNKSAALSHKNLETEEIEKLKNLVAAYKKKSTQAIQALYENEHQKIKQETTLAHQLKDLQERVKELTEENRALHEQQSSKLHKSELDFESQLEQERQLNQALQREVQELSKNLDSQRSLQREVQELSKSLENSQRHSEQLDRALKHLHERSQEAYLELSQLREDFQRSQEAVIQHTEQLQLTQKHLHETTQELHLVQAEKQEMIQEMEALQGQFSALKVKVSESQEALSQALQEKLNLEEGLESKTQLFKRFEGELSILKQSLSKGIHDSKEIEGMYLDIVNEKAELCNRSTHLEELLNTYSQEIKGLQAKLEDATRKEAATQEQMGHLEKDLKERHQEELNEFQKRNRDLENSLQKHHESLREKEREIEEASHQILLLSQEKLKLENSLADVARYQNEQDAHMRAAQQHLGKKVKEVTLLNEKFEIQQAQNIDLQNTLTQLKAKMEEMQQSFDQKMQQEKKHQEQLHESIRFAENQVVKWEDKCLKAYEKLKVLEEKQQQFQTLFSSLGSVMGVMSTSATIPLSLPTPTSFKEALHFGETPKVQQEEPIQKERSFAPSEPSLFDIDQKSRKNIRQNLFD